MRERIKDNIFSLSGISIFIGAFGFVSSIVTSFININAQVSIKWLILLSIILVYFVAILLKVIYDIHQEPALQAPYEQPVNYNSNSGVFIIRRNENFINSIYVGCYAIQDEVHTLAYIGEVYLVQSNLVQIRLIADIGFFKEVPTTQEALKQIVIKPGLPIDAISYLTNME